MKNHLKHTLFILAATLPMAAWADQIITGTIRDAQSQQGLAGVYVQDFMNEKFTTMTDSVGHYSIKVSDYCTSLRVRRAGYNMMQVSINGRTEGVDAEVFPDVFKNQVGLEQNALTTLTANISDMSADLSVDNQISTSLGGQIRSVSRGGVAGLGNYMLVGGINSLNANAQPLFVIDGVIMDMQYERETLHDGMYNNLLANIMIDDIAEVQVLRNGTALYGAMGSNGVVIINTKRNHSLTTKIDVSAHTSFEMLPKLPEMMNASEYRTYCSELLGTTDTKLTDFKFLREDPNYYYYKVYHNETDWTKEVYSEAFSQGYSLNVQGGDDVANYNLSVGFAKGEATLKDNNYNRFNMRINSDVHLSSRVKIRLDASYSDLNRDMRDDGVAANIDAYTITSPGFLSLIKSPFLSPYAYDTQGNLSSFLAGADDYLSQVIEKSKGSLANPASILYYGEADNKNKFGNRVVTLGIIPTAELKHHLTLSNAFNFVMATFDENYYLPVTGVPQFEFKHIGMVHNLVASSASHQYLISNDIRLNWKYNKQGHRLDLTGGFRFRASTYQLNNMKGYNSGNDKMPNMNTNLQYKKTEGINESIKTLTYYATADYNYLGKYFVNAGISAEADSRFGADAKNAINLCGASWALFPSANASWIVSNEDWFRQSWGINYLRLNAGYDMTGNSNIDLNASKTYFKAISLLARVGGTVAGNIGNTELKWETTNRIHAGADANLLGNRLSVSANVFQSWTHDLLAMHDLPYVIGIGSNWGNSGKLKNTGVDLTLTGKVVNGKDFKWELGASLGHYRNEITSLPNGEYETSYCNGIILTRVGESAGVFYGYRTNGVLETTAEAQAAALYRVDETGTKHYFEAGDMQFVDKDGNHEINANDREVIGNPNPDIYGNIFTRLSYKNLSLDVMFNYSVGNDIYNYQRSILEGGNRFYNQTTAMRGRWSSEGQHTNIPRINYEDEMGNARFSDRWIEDGSYLRLKNVTLSYKWDFDYRFLQGVTLWGSANNLLTFTKYLGSDPEVSGSNNLLFQGIDRGILPSSRTFSVGVKINL